MGKLAETDRFLSRNREESTEAPSQTTDRLDRWLTTLLQQKGSDLLLIAGAPPSIRLEGEVRSLESEPLQGAEIEALVLPALTKHALQRYREDHIGDPCSALQSSFSSRTQPPACSRVAGALAPWAGPRRRRDGLGQINYARSPDRRD